MKDKSRVMCQDGMPIKLQSKMTSKIDIKKGLITTLSNKLSSNDKPKSKK